MILKLTIGFTIQSTLLQVENLGIREVPFTGAVPAKIIPISECQRKIGWSCLLLEELINVCYGGLSLMSNERIASFLVDKWKIDKTDPFFMLPSQRSCFCRFAY